MEHRTQANEKCIYLKRFRIFARAVKKFRQKRYEYSNRRRDQDIVAFQFSFITMLAKLIARTTLAKRCCKFLTIGEADDSEVLRQ